MRGAWAPGKGRGSSAWRVETGGEAEENDGMLKVVEERRRCAKGTIFGKRTEKKKVWSEAVTLSAGHASAKAAFRLSTVAPTAEPVHDVVPHLDYLKISLSHPDLFLNRSATVAPL